MKNINYKNKYLLTVTVVFLIIIEMSSCKKFVQIDPPLTQISSEAVFNNNATATGAMTAIYAQIDNNGFMPLNVDRYSGMSADEFINYNASILETNLYRNNLSAADGNLATNIVWTPCYNYIFQANNIIEGLQKSSQISTSVKQQLIGEAKFMRAFFNFYLTNFYGDVPLITTTDYSSNRLSRRASQKEVYQQIIQDLIEAQQLLNNNYVDASSISNSTERVRPTKWAACALLARVYLYYGNLTGDAGNFQLAEQQATAVIGNSSLYKITTIDSVFLKNNKEAIWQIAPKTSRGFTYEGNYFILTGQPSSISLSSLLINAFDPADLRLKKWINAITVSGNAYYYPYKYKVRVNTTPVPEYSTLLRLAEQYLIRAEARTRLSNISGAQTDLNTIRNRAGLSNTTASDQSSLLNSILKERQLELFSEGHRWFDLKRMGAADLIMTNVTPQKGGGNWKSYQQFYPIGTTELLNGINLTQTTGY